MLPIDTIQLLTAAAVFLRITGIVSLLPLFGEGSVPVRVRIILSAALAVGVYPSIPESYGLSLQTSLSDVWIFSFVMAKELLIGVVIGYTAKLAFEGVVMAAYIVGVQMGFSTSTIFMPDSDATTNAFSALHRLLIVLIFLSLNLHHMYLTSMVDSFRMIPFGFAWPSASLSELLVSFSGSIFVTALQLAAPTLIGLLFTTAALGLISRAVPQANVFVMSFPVSFFAGLIIYMATLPMLPGWLRGHFSESQMQLLAALKSLTST